MPRDFTEEQIAQYKDAFNQLDVDGNGVINVEELGTAMKSIGKDTSEENLQTMITLVDKDGDGKIDFDEFLIMIAG